MCFLIAFLSLVRCAFANTPKFAEAQRDGGHIVQAQWIDECFTQRRALPWQQFELSADEDDDGGSAPASTGDPVRAPPRRRGNVTSTRPTNPTNNDDADDSTDRIDDFINAMINEDEDDDWSPEVERRQNDADAEELVDDDDDDDELEEDDHAVIRGDAYADLESDSESDAVSDDDDSNGYA